MFQANINNLSHKISINYTSDFKTVDQFVLSKKRSYLLVYTLQIKFKETLITMESD